jgi:hypothetical protein
MPHQRQRAECGRGQDAGIEGRLQQLVRGNTLPLPRPRDGTPPNGLQCSIAGACWQLLRLLLNMLGALLLLLLVLRRRLLCLLHLLFCLLFCLLLRLVCR